MMVLSPFPCASFSEFLQGGSVAPQLELDRAFFR